ncbi:hypothetical protein B4U80_12794 [Leptotrombidium deliense]|uniref:Peptidoglycan recognition protein family domain-containing protein n=1 Tax=Leptotrombidium deliense TaxID=299467 RepID=A0A443SLS6_9ACAR|nr:hypothetical protein B4U80_12794 [Leptotrombidium deliense]
MRDIGYNFIIAGDHNVYETRGWHIPDDILASGQSHSISIALVGQFNDKPPSKEMLDAASNLIKCGQQSGFIAENYELHYEQDSPCAPNSGEALYNALKKWPQFRQSSSTSQKIC